ncbi:uncharacterized protein LAESUDRAFT_741049 [Laetiporus sulphureus 93-53]|uniref:Shr3 amino acid permease chaperone n=1 Tax=Laetiporus sulphureus 93-53 TaxID=1314785 RepID=A0A165HE64_9APHY|nr:uncharacterized protein LAESUDRAFT_741049 [Laetiporus sulphureus 93-53]KZT11616.1 hypothetical protein LAESUDRAFT_741049 [Laetiporus sulphureus 93-53]
MAGLRMSVVVSATAFLLGILFTHWIADSLTLWQSPETQTDQRLWTAAAYYSVLSRMQPQLAYVSPAVALVGGLTILWSFRDGRAGNLMFDGGSIFLYGTAIYIYIQTVLPNISANFSSLPLPFPNHSSPILSSPPADLPPFPASLRTAILELASSHLICSVVLTGVLTLQAGRWWAEQADTDENDAVMGEDGDADEKERAKGGRREETPVVETKKTQ